MGNVGSNISNSFDSNNTSTGAYEYGYNQGFHDAATGSTGDPVDYALSCTPSGNQGYTAGYAAGSQGSNPGSNFSTVGEGLSVMTDAISKSK